MYKQNNQTNATKYQQEKCRNNQQQHTHTHEQETKMTHMDTEHKHEGWKNRCKSQFVY